jgi:CheY-like chemotaxis protein
MSDMEPEIPRLHPVEGSGEGGAFPRSGIGADEALLGFAIAGTLRGGLERRRMAPVVASALRVAVDHLMSGAWSGMPLRLSADDAALEVRLDGVEPSGLAPAGEVLESVEGHLGIVPGVPGTWMIRVPLLTPNETFLLLEQGSLSLAIPWHAVVRMRIATSESLARSAGQEGYAILPPTTPLSDPLGDHPVVLLGLGLRRAYLLADQIIWRMAAEPTDEAAPRGAGLGPMVRTHEGRPFAMLDTVRLLRDVAPPPLPHVDDTPAHEALDAHHLEALPAREPLDAPPPTAGAMAVAVADDRAPMPATPPILRLVELSSTDVEPLAEPAPAPRALIAEDSIVAAIFLTRLLEKEGFEVVPVGTAAELHQQVATAHWSVVFVDVELPDAIAGQALSGLEPHNAAGAAIPVVALVRDADDIAHAGAYGVLRSLMKPFEAESLLLVLGELGFRR